MEEWEKTRLVESDKQLAAEWKHDTNEADKQQKQKLNVKLMK